VITLVMHPCERHPSAPALIGLMWGSARCAVRAFRRALRLGCALRNDGTRVVERRQLRAARGLRAPRPRCDGLLRRPITICRSCMSLRSICRM